MLDVVRLTARIPLPWTGPPGGAEGLSADGPAEHRLLVWLEQVEHGLQLHKSCVSGKVCKNQEPVLSSKKKTPEKSVCGLVHLLKIREISIQSALKF